MSDEHPSPLPAPLSSELPPTTPAGAESPATGPEPEPSTTAVWGRRPLDDSDGWEQMSAKKLLLGPVDALRAMIVPLGAVLLGTSSFGSLWSALAFAGIALLGAVFSVIPWYTQRFRITDTQLQYRTGLLNRATKTVPLDRVRSVDLEAKLLHRLIGLRTVQIGTGVDDDRIELNGLGAARAEQMRAYLLAGRSRTSTAPAPVPAPAGGPSGALSDVDPAPAQVTAPPAPDALAPERLLAKIDWTWLRFAPFDLTRLAVIAAALGVIAQAAGEGFVPENAWSNLDDSARTLAEFGVTLLVVLVTVIALLGWVVVAIIGYVVQWWGLKLSSGGGSLHMSHGLLTTRSVSVEEARIRGVALGEPLLLRPVRGANLHTLATGVGSGGLTRVLPQAPTSVALRVGSDVLESDVPLNVALVRHNGAARRRAHVRQQWSTLALAVLALIAHHVLTRFTDVDAQLWWFLVPAALWLLIAPVRAELAFAHLGHALTPRHFVVGSGTSTRTRTVLEVDGIIGWVVERSWFQRRLGLCTLVATTAAGNEQVTLLDVEEDVALALMAAATPEAVAPFMA